MSREESLKDALRMLRHRRQDDEDITGSFSGQRYLTVTTNRDGEEWVSFAETIEEAEASMAEEIAPPKGSTWEGTSWLPWGIIDLDDGSIHYTEIIVKLSQDIQPEHISQYLGDDNE